MIHRLACKATNIFIREGSAQEEDRELYIFGAEQGIWMLLNVATAGILGCLTGELLSCIVYLLLYIPLRRYAGGFHAAGYVRCWAGSGVMILAVLLAVRYREVPIWAELLIILACAVLIARLSPVTVPNRPLSDEEKTIYRKKASKYLNKGGVLLMEAGDGQAQDIIKLVKGADTVNVIKDLEGKDRIIKAVF